MAGSLLNISEALSPASGFQVAGPLPQLSSLPPVVRLWSSQKGGESKVKLLVSRARNRDGNFLAYEERFLKGCYSADVSYADATANCINAGENQLSPQLK